jgi:hypothetical protein
MLALIPLAALVGLAVLLATWKPAWDWRRALLRATALWAFSAAGMVEFLSLGWGITQSTLTIAWATILIVEVAALAWLIRHGARLRGPASRFPKGWLDRSITVGVIAILAITAIVAWFAPPSTWDSLNYHMPRVAHWAQERSLRPFATGIEIQNSQSPGMELLVLHLYVLAGGDRLANFVGWGAFAGSLLAVASIVGRLGGGARAERLAPLLVATAPMALVQASSTMTDGVAGFWCACAAAETLAIREGSRGATIWASLVAGLAVLTKPTAAAFLLPFGVWAAIQMRRTMGWRRASLAGAAALGVILLINAGHIARNIALYGQPMNPVRVARHANGMRDLRGLTSNLLRYTSVQLGTPSALVNRAMTLGVIQVHEWLGVDVNDPRTTSAGVFNIRPPLTHEDLTINPLHAALFSWAAVALLVRRREAGAICAGYALVTASTLIVFSAVFKWEVFGGRYLLPFFVLFAPAAGVALARLARPSVQAAAAAMLVVACWPWLTGIRSRPLIERPGDSTIRSVLVESRVRAYFANGLYLEDPYREMAAEVEAASCDRVGLMLGGNAAEYPLWVLLGAPREDVQIEWIVAGDASVRFEDPGFEPCAVVCDESCPGDWPVVRGLPLGYEQSGFRLYIGEPSPP